MLHSVELIFFSADQNFFYILRTISIVMFTFGWFFVIPKVWEIDSVLCQIDSELCHIAQSRHIFTNISAKSKPNSKMFQDDNQWPNEGGSVKKPRSKISWQRPFKVVIDFATWYSTPWVQQVLLVFKATAIQSGMFNTFWMISQFKNFNLLYRPWGKYCTMYMIELPNVSSLVLVYPFESHGLKRMLLFFLNNNLLSFFLSYLFHFLIYPLSLPAI
jgi:hypothetical protein